MKCAPYLALILCIASCTYDNTAPLLFKAEATILGQWTVQTDSLNIGGFPQIYKKSNSDYYEFLSNGILIVSEGGVIDTADYSLPSNKEISIQFRKNKTLVQVNFADDTISDVTLKGRLGILYTITDFSSHSVKMSDSFSWVDDPPVVDPTHPPVGVLKVNKAIWLKK